jgi:ATP-dependent protease ClpP protease subunit
MFINEYQQKKYNEVFDKVYNSLKKQREEDSKYTIEELESLLDSLYNLEGSDWLGKGLVKDITNQATISACEQLLVEWKEELHE